MNVQASGVRALIFDVFGTVVDWHGSVAREVRGLAKAKGLRVNAVKFAKAWRAGYRPAMDRVLRGEVADMKMPGREIKPGIWVGLNTSIAWDKVRIEGPVYIGSSVCIESGATIIGPAWIGHGSHIRTGAKVVRSVLFEYTRVPADMQFNEMIVSPDYCVDRMGETQYRGDDRSQLRWGDARA